MIALTQHSYMLWEKTFLITPKYSNLLKRKANVF